MMMIYLLGIGSPTHPLPASSWDAWKRPTIKYEGLEFISGMIRFSRISIRMPGLISGKSETRTRIILRIR